VEIAFGRLSNFSLPPVSKSMLAGTLLHQALVEICKWRENQCCTIGRMKYNIIVKVYSCKKLAGQIKAEYCVSGGGELDNRGLSA
jgi:hypothetical protein